MYHAKIMDDVSGELIGTTREVHREKPINSPRAGTVNVTQSEPRPSIKRIGRIGIIHSIYQLTITSYYDKLNSGIQHSHRICGQSRRQRRNIEEQNLAT